MNAHGVVVLLTLAVAAALTGSTSAAEKMVHYRQRWHIKLESLDPNDVLSKLDLSGPGLEQAQAAAKAGKRTEALTALLETYRKKYPLPPTNAEAKKRSFPVADDIVRHIFQWGPYEKAEYGPEINWEWDPRGDIEWVAAVYRFHWVTPLAEAYRATRDKKYVRAFVELTTDWIGKHPLEKHTKTHPVYKSWRGFAWLDIQTGIRATRICEAFRVLVHGEAFTPEFLGVLLASLYDHQVKTEKIPMGIVHNKAIFEQRGFVNIAYTFREFRDAKRWMKIALERAEQNLLAQTTPDGVQREWSGGYHLGVLRDAVQIAERADSFGLEPSKAYRDRIRGMYDYIFWMATPDLGFPMFGDVSRPIDLPKDRSGWPLYRALLRGTKVTDDPKYAARAHLKRDALPQQTSHAFKHAGMYVMRSEWGPRQLYFALHCSPPAISGHDQPDNGTFELCAFGRWLMNDSGYYTYGHDPKGRAWHRQTRVHQTLTLDGKDTKVAGTLRFWQSSDDFDALVVENASYKGLVHRRSVWFPERRFIVLLDEALGSAKGKLALHFQFAPGAIDVDEAAKSVTTRFEDANVLLQCDRKQPIWIQAENGWFGYSYGKRKPRKAVTITHAEQAPAAFLTVLWPYEGTKAPKVSAELGEEFEAGIDAVNVRVTVNGKTWRLGRDLRTEQAFCRPQ